MMITNKLTTSTALPSFSSRALMLLVCTAVGVAACTASSGSGEAAAAEYHVTSTRPSAQVTVTNEGGSAIVEVYSDNGIGSASVSLIGGNWPDAILMRFHLQGLEGLQFLYNENVVNISVNTQDMILQSAAIDGAAEEAIDKESDYWMPITFVDKVGTAVDSPAAGGVIEVEAPANFLAGEYAEFTINWIDFYR